MQSSAKEFKHLKKEQKQNNKNQNTHDWRKRQSEVKNGGGREQLKTQHTQIYSLKRMEFFYIAVFCIMKTMPKFLPGAVGLCLSNCVFFVCFFVFFIVFGLTLAVSDVYTDLSTQNAMHF